MTSKTLFLIVTFLFSPALFAGGFWYEITGQADHDYQAEIYRARMHVLRYGKPFRPGNVYMSEVNREQVYQYSLQLLAEQQAAQAHRASVERPVVQTPNSFSDYNDERERVVSMKAAEEERESKRSVVFTRALHHFLTLEGADSQFSFERFNRMKAADREFAAHEVFNQLEEKIRLFYNDSALSFLQVVDSLVQKKLSTLEAFARVRGDRRDSIVQQVSLAVAISAAQQQILNRIWNLDLKSETAVVGRQLIRAANYAFEIQMKLIKDPQVAKAVPQMSEAISQQLRSHDVGSHVYWLAKGIMKRDLVSHRPLQCSLLFL